MIWKKFYIIVLSFVFVSSAYAETLVPDQTMTDDDQIKIKIEERNIQIKNLEEEIKQYNQEVINAGSQAQTLQSTIKTLDLTKTKLNKDLTLTQSKITNTNLTIDGLTSDIKKTQNSIDVDRQALISAIRNMSDLEDQGIVTLILSKKNLSELWGDLDITQQIGETIRNKSKELSVLKASMEAKQGSLKTQKTNLLSLKQDLTGKKQAVEFTTKQKADLLVQTKNKEQTFKEIVKSKEELKAQFEQEVFEYESQLHYIIDKNSYPLPKNGILSWPLDSVFVTQKFGKTVGAEKLYTSGSHNGIDLRASIGTRVKNVLEGDVVGTGNTDQYPGCYSFGKWVMVKHDNGLSTIYGHLSVISVGTGQRVGTGDLVGYSGNTGYSTGPHLHISVYATQGVRIEQFVNSRGCKQAVLPLADIKAYLDPLAYFPKI